MRFELLALWRLPRKEPQERLVLRLDLLAGYAEEFGSFSGPGTHDVFTLAIVIVGGIVVTQPLGAIAHFSHRPHWGRRLAKNPLRGQARQNRFGAERQYAKFWPVGCCKNSRARIWRIASLLIFPFRAIFRLFRLFTVFGVANSSSGMRPLPRNYLFTKLD